MPRALQAWYSRDDLETLADRRSVLRGEYRVAKLARLDGLVHAEHAQAVAITLSARQSAGGQLKVALAIQGSVLVTCQRCLDSLEWLVDEDTEWLVVDSESDARRLGAGEAVLVLEHGRLHLEALLEDELIVALPLAPRHERIDDCGPLARNFSAEPHGAATDRVGGSREV